MRPADPEHPEPAKPEEERRSPKTLPRQREDITDVAPPGDPARSGKNSDSPKRADIPPDV
jgi:hypothetical protein